MDSIRHDAGRLEALLAEIVARIAAIWPDRAGRDFRRTRLKPLCDLVDNYAREAARFERELAEAMSRLP